MRRVTALATISLPTLIAACLLLVAGPVYAATFTVNSTGDTGDNNPGNGSCFTGVLIPGPGVGLVQECTLRAAIQEANANNNDATVVDEVHFTIPGAGPHTISPGTALPDITEPLVIDGYTEPGAEPNTLAVGDNADLRIRLDGDYPTKTIAGLRIAADDCVIRGLSVTRFFSALPVLGTSDNTIEGNFIGTDPSGTQALGNPNSVFIGEGSTGNLIGGDTPGARNIISGNDFGVNISDTAGGAQTTDNKVQGNYIGTTRSGTGDLGNGDFGVIVSGSDNLVGGSSRTRANIIAFNGGSFNRDGVAITDDAGTGNRIMGNSIYANADLGIDLGPSGVTPNDGPGDADTGANNLQNFPVLDSARTGKRAAVIKGTLESTENSAFTIQFFANPKSTRDEGKKFIGKKTVTTDAGGQASFTFKTKKVRAGMFVTATATNDSTGDTSEFSAPEKVRG